MDGDQQKRRGAYYTPDAVVRSLVRWAVRGESDRMLDPACGDGRFLVAHGNSVGVEQDPDAARTAHARAPGAFIHRGDFFCWANETDERFDCAAGNPPFIRYQHFTGEVRNAALALCRRHGARFSSLSSSWAPFIVAAAALLKPGGRMAFVVPAEIGHAPYAKPLLDYLIEHFGQVQVVAIQRRVFPELSEDCWLLYADGFGARADHLLLSPMTQFGFMGKPPPVSIRISLGEQRRWNWRLRPFLLPSGARAFYEEVADSGHSMRLGDIAVVGIGYVTGDNRFFHLRPSEAERMGIPPTLLQPTVRSGKMLTGRAITPSRVRAWRRRDEPNFLLRLKPSGPLPVSVRRYLDSDAGQKARTAYKCRNRQPWYVVPDVALPDAFLAYMSGNGASLVANRAGCSGTNSVHMVTLKGPVRTGALQEMWRQPFTALSCEIEGHPLGGGMLKLEPREAGRVVVTRQALHSKAQRTMVREGIATMRQWRHLG